MARYVARSPRVPPGPSLIAVETTVRCNLRCPMCPRTGAGLPAEDMADALLWPLLEEHAALGGDLVWLNGLGEPLLDPRLFDVLDRCASLGLSTVVATNATLLDEARRRALLDTPIDHVIASVDGATAATYARYRPGGRLAEVEANVEALAALKRARRHRGTLTVQMVRMAGTVPEERAFRRRWRAVPGVDAVRLKEEEFGRDGFATDASYVTGAASRTNPCRILWMGPVIVRWNGDVAACHPRAAGGLLLGNLRERSLGELWAGPEAERLRALHRVDRAATDAACARCPVARPRLPFLLAGMAVRGATMQRLVPWAERLGGFRER